MVSTKNTEEKMIYGEKLSSVGPARVTGDLIYDPSNIDLAMKLHYLRIVYLFEGQAAEALLMPKVKEPIFSWLCYYYESCGRLRRPPPVDSDGHPVPGRPFIKCNDCGIRFVEVKSSKTLEEWLQLGDAAAHQRLLAPTHIIGPELTFSPLVFLQITSFKCGGVSVGLSWGHVLGDAFSASDFMNLLAQFIKGYEPTYPTNLNKSPPNVEKPIKQCNMGQGPLSLKQVGPVEDHWTLPPPCDMDTFSFHVTKAQLAQLKTKVSKNDPTHCRFGPFEALSAVVWRAIAKAEDAPKPNTITVIKRGISSKANDLLLRNSQVVSSVKAHFCVAEAHPIDLVKLIRDEAQDERAQIEEMVGENPGGSDFIVYGSNPTFVDLGEAEFYGFELKGLKPKLVNCFVDGIGGDGVVLVLPSPKNDNYHVNNGIEKNNGKIEDDYEGRIVTLILPRVYMEDIKKDLKEEWTLID